MKFINDPSGDDRTFLADGLFICWGCGAELDACKLMTETDEPRPPKHMDLNVCAHCGQIMVCGENGEFHEPTLDDLLILQDTKAWKSIEAASQKIKENPLPLE